MIRHNGYVPAGLGIGRGDDVDLDIDLTTGQIIGWKPITIEAAVKAIKVEKGEEEADED